MRVVQFTIELDSYQRAVAAALQDDRGLVFFDTNVVAWSFRLNEAAHGEFAAWIEHLAHGRRLAIPAWVVHEYNHHLLQDDSTFFLPHKGVGKQLQSNLAELERDLFRIQGWE